MVINVFPLQKHCGGRAKTSDSFCDREVQKLLKLANKAAVN